MSRPGTLDLRRYFVIKDGVVLWTCQDAEVLDNKLRLIRSGKFSIKNAVAEDRARTEWQPKQDQDTSVLVGYDRLYYSPKTRLKVLDAVERSRKVSPQRIEIERIRTLAELGDPTWQRRAKELLAGPIGKDERWLRVAADGVQDTKTAQLCLLYARRLRVLNPTWANEVQEASALAWAGQVPEGKSQVRSLLERMRREKAFSYSIRQVENVLRLRPFEPQAK